MHTLQSMIVAAVAVLAGTSPVSAQPPCEPNPELLITSSLEDCETAFGLGPQLTRPSFPRNDEYETQFNGMPLNLSLQIGPVAGDYPPVHRDIIASTSPLVPAKRGSFAGFHSLPERVMAGGLMDAITGMPLLREVDFELSFGSAVYRQIRTYSEASDFAWHPLERDSLTGMGVPGTAPSSPSRKRIPDELFWDWAGQGWMIGENPAFLFDLGFRGYVSADPEGTATKARCYFMPDMHRSIPFERIENPSGPPSYIAPPQFDALLEYDTSTVNWDHQTRTWVTPPSQVTIWLHRRTVGYVIQVLHDVAVAEPYPCDPEEFPCGKMHHESFRGGLGVPRLGRVTKIIDRDGNEVRIFYSGILWTSEDLNSQAGCKACWYSSSQNGQISSVQLVPAGETQPAWTLLYTYRAFSDRPPPSEPTLHPLPHRQQAIRSIHVYKGDVPGGVLLHGGGRTIPPNAYDSIELVSGDCDRHIMEQYLAAFDAVGDEPTPFVHEDLIAPSGWQIEVKYLYSDPNHSAVDAGAPIRGYGQCSPFAGAAGPFSPNDSPRLLKVSVTDRRMAPEATTSPKPLHTLYRYSVTKTCGGLSVIKDWQIHHLTGVLYPGSVEKLLGYEYAVDPDSDPEWLPVHVYALVAASDMTGFRESSLVPHVHRMPKLLDHSISRLGPPVPMRQSGTHPRVLEHVGLEPELAVQIDKGVSGHGRRASDGSSTTWHRVTPFLYDPPMRAVFGEWSLSGQAALASPCSAVINSAIHHYPYRLISAETFDDESQWNTRDLDQPMWVTVVDEIVEYHTTNDPDDRVTRIYILNAAGMMLEHWVLEGGLNQGGEWQLEGGSALRDIYIYEPIGGWDFDSSFTGERRIKQIRTKGWAAASMESTQPGSTVSPQTHGLVYHYEYVTGDPYEVAGISISSGNGINQPRYWVMRQERHQDYKCLIAREHEYTAPALRAASGPQPDGDIIREHHYQFGSLHHLALEYGISTQHLIPQVTRHVVFEPAAPHSPGGAPRRAFTFEMFATTGVLLGRAVGDCGDVVNGLPSQVGWCTWELWMYDQLGRVTTHTIDGNTMFAGIARQSPPLLALQTIYTYEDAAPAPIEIEHFDNTRTFRVHGVDAQGNSETTIFERMRETQVGGMTGYALDGKVRKLVTDSMKKTVLSTGSIAAPISGAPDASTPVDYKRHAFPKVDTAGKLVELAIDDDLSPEEPVDPAPAIKAFIDYDGWGRVVRERHPSGRITRNVYDEFGRHTRTFVGTDDAHEVWGTDFNNDPCSEPYTDNMTLTEKRTYGLSHTNAAQLVTLRSYTTRPTNQYFGDLCELPPNNEDQIGTLIRYGHDWRMRQVWEEHYAEGPGTSLIDLRSVTAKYLDHAGRERFIAVFAPASLPAAGSAADPRAAAPGDDVPDAQTILAARPVTLREIIYDSRGRLYETRTYECPPNFAQGHTPKYTATRQYYDHLDRPTVMRSPGGGETWNQYDPLGRIVAEEQRAAGVTLSRVEYTLDANGRPIETTTHERAHDASSSPTGLDATNSITSRTFTWYDSQGRVLALADLGTEHSGNQYRNADVNPIDRFDAANQPIPPPTYEQINGTWGIQRHVLPASARISINEYDSFGNVILAVSPDGAAVRKKYDAFGRLVLAVENPDSNAGGTSPHDRRITAYQYDNAGRLAKIAAVKSAVETNGEYTFDWNATDGSVQVIDISYGAAGQGAPILNADGQAASPAGFDPMRPAAIYLPDPATGQPSANAAYQYAYLVDGTLARITDARGIALSYTYDHAKELATIAVDESQASIPPGGWALDRITHVEYSRDALGRLTSVLARSGFGQPSAVCLNTFAYHASGHLSREDQDHGSSIVVGDSAVRYERYTVSGTTGTGQFAGLGVNRLDRIIYPNREFTGGDPFHRAVMYDYGASEASSSHAAAVTNATSRVRRIAHFQDGQGSAGPTTAIADFAYSGLGRRVQMSLGRNPASGNPLLQGLSRWSARIDTAGTAQPGPGYAGLDAFGAVRTWRWSSGASGGGTMHQELVYGYDAAGRRESSRVTHLSSPTTPVSNHRSWKHEYDRLGRVTASDRGALAAGVISDPPGGQAQFRSWRHDALENWSGASGIPGYAFDDGQSVLELTDVADALNRVRSRDDGTTQTSHAYDAAGNLIFDGDYVYQYDAFGRLVQVNNKGGVGVDAQGNLTNTGSMGLWQRHYTYDGLGRLIRQQSPMSPIAAQLRTERYYYDGQRRIAEVYTDPLGSPDGKPLTMVSERGGGVPGSNPDPNGYYKWTGREYIWGPDGNDELLAQVDAGHWPWLVVTDGAPSFTPQLLIRGEADNGQVPTQPAGRPVAQYSWNPYGSLTGMETLAPHNSLWVGHHGRFFLRFDGDGAANPLTPTAKGVYHARNRAYDPWLGRFLQADPNGTGTPVAVGVWCQGEHPQALAAQADAMAMVTDGLNRYAFCRADPVNATDPMGLFFSIGDVLGGSTWQSELQEEAAGQYADVQQSITDSLGGLFDSIAMDQWADAFWALDWSQPDDFYSQSAEAATGRGSWEGFWDSNSSDSSTGRAIASGGGFGLGSSTRSASAGVYVLKDNDGNIVYVGRSRNMEERKRYWERQGKKFVSLYQNLTYDEMRGLEQHAMDENGYNEGRLRNKIRGVSKSNPNAVKYANAAEEFIRGRR